MLLRVSKNKSKGEACVALVIRILKQEDIFDGCHIGPAGNHEGRDRTQAKIVLKYILS